MSSDFDNLHDNLPPEDYPADKRKDETPSFSIEEMQKFLEKNEKAEKELAAWEEMDMTLPTKEHADEHTEAETEKKQSEQVHESKEEEQHATETRQSANAHKEQRREPSPHLEDLALKNLTSRHLLNVYRHFERHLERKIDQVKSQTLSEKDVEQLLDNHLKQVHDLLDHYFADREMPVQGKSWKSRLGDYKQGLGSRMESLKNQVDHRIRSLKAAPGRLKRALQDKVIDGFVSLNGRISAHADAAARRLALHRSVPKETLLPGDERIASAYKLNYQKAVFNDFVGGKYYKVNHSALAAGDTMFSPEARFQLRREALSTWLKQGPVLGHGRPEDRQAEQFRQYLIQRDAALEENGHTLSASPAKRQAFLDQDLGDCAPDVRALRQQIQEKGQQTPDRKAGPSYTLPPRSAARSSLGNSRAAAAEHIL
ncbi:hypothetical protein NIE88_10305 [Sporolactobacillus shoreicorticis]|uniref:Uncharacterized protein n=1 Tax=Sporolactobacillus shoreicorticis TaxID=1923877 RepID=A0ABW5S8T9_9BACL|nr:hypothetical protein [Sporolactobacillus shoreicorticis]MCO7126166.1 hypothetical protein [Sporolactobacillus shoreicorticis]